MVTSDGHLMRSGEPSIRSMNTHNYDLITDHDPPEEILAHPKELFDHLQ